MIDRRACLCGLAAGAVMPAARAQPAGQRLSWVVFQGFGPIVTGDEETVFGPLRDRLRELGYADGRTLRFEFRSGQSRYPGTLPASPSGAFGAFLLRRVTLDERRRISVEQFAELARLVELLRHPHMRGRRDSP